MNCRYYQADRWSIAQSNAAITTATAVIANRIATVATPALQLWPIELQLLQWLVRRAIIRAGLHQPGVAE